jgi:hypothetical protein
MTKKNLEIEIPPDIEKSMYQKVELMLHNWKTFERNRGCVFVDLSAMTLGDDCIYYYHPLENRKVLRVTIFTDGSKTPNKVEIDTY